MRLSTATLLPSYLPIGHSVYVCRCLQKSQTYPPSRFIWCNDGRHGGDDGPKARHVDSYGHACCKNSDLCNLRLSPILKDYKKGGQQLIWNETNGFNPSHSFQIVTYICSLLPNLILLCNSLASQISCAFQIFTIPNCAREETTKIALLPTFSSS